MKENVFNNLYKKLNSKQKLAVDTIDGPVIVIAGPGTGKTSILTLRIANILRKTDLNPENILALTFTESGVNSMRRKLIDIIGSDAYKVGIYTFHGFCNDVIKDNPDFFPRIIESTNSSDVDRINIIESVLDNGRYKFLKPRGNKFHYVKSVLSSISELKRENISASDFELKAKKSLEEFKKRDDLYYKDKKYNGKMKGCFSDLMKRIEKNIELSKIYKEYEKQLRNRKLYDYEDMILEVIKTFEKNQEMLMVLQEKHQYILIDEHQDTNNSQNKIIELVSSFYDNPNVFIVGDSKQAIYRFQGASLENFLYFKNKFKNVKVIELNENYRSSQMILDASKSLIEKNVGDESAKIKLISAVKNDKKDLKIRVFSGNNFEEECLDIASEIKRKIEKGADQNKIAVFCRDNEETFDAAQVFKNSGMDFVIVSEAEMLKDENVQKIISILKTVENFGNNVFLPPTMFVDFFNLDYLDLFKLFSFCDKNKISAYDIISSEKELRKIGVSNRKIFLNFYEKIKKWAVLSKNSHILSLLTDIIQESGIIEKLSNRPVREYLIVGEFFDKVKQISSSKTGFSLGDFLSYVDSIQKHGMQPKSRTGDDISEQNGVRIMTAHKSKGLEFDHVYIIGSNDKKWGNRKKRKDIDLSVVLSGESIDENEDERKLFYVSMTRAKKEICITHSRFSETGSACLPSQFINEIDTIFLDKKEISFKKSQKIPAKLLRNRGAGLHTENFDVGASKKAEKKRSDGVNTEKTFKNNVFLNHLFLGQGLSVSAINNYIKCPWNYFFNNLIRIPKAEEPHQLYGTSIHETLNYFLKSFIKGKRKTTKEILSFFEKTMRKKSFSRNDLAEFLERGKKAIKGYMNEYGKNLARNAISEMNIAEIFIDVSLDSHTTQKILLKGRLDKVEFLEDGFVNVVDYKTGGQKTRNYIEGKTKNSAGNEKRQLIFYKLLLDEYEKRKYKMKSGEIDFVEPDKKGRYKKEKFIISEQETKELKNQIKKISKEILALSFWNEFCSDKNCEFCHLRKIIE